MKKIGLFTAGVLFGTAGMKLLGSRDAKKVYAQTTQGEFLLRRRLYELEQILDRRYFVRISKSEIVNLRFVRRLDLSIAGTIGMQLKTGETAYVSRRYVNHIKSILEQGAFS